MHEMLFLCMSATNSLHVAVVLQMISGAFICLSGQKSVFSVITGQIWHCNILYTCRLFLKVVDILVSHFKKLVSSVASNQVKERWSDHKERK